MPRRSSGGRTAPRPVRNPPQPARSAPPPAPVQGGSALGGIGATIADGIAFGTGSAIAHRAVDSVLGPRTIQHEMVPSSPSSYCSSVEAVLWFRCLQYTFQSLPRCKCINLFHCINNFGSDISKCQFYLDMLNECRRGSGGVVLIEQHHCVVGQESSLILILLLWNIV
ncbi:hypothetical protein C4D60_Mb10t19820 [Musa balbisiana]|uniref:CHCH domain-containing protein n=1 Tax=Musa balbisiana TaxID=52838 RepID=A0A4S8J0W9_MUSBA|nr:hypothetical protein C4D60_Mb10t19820 [Musa balbisiana]